VRINELGNCRYECWQLAHYLMSHLGPDTFRSRNALRGLKEFEHRSNFPPPQFLGAGDSNQFFFLNICVTPTRRQAGNRLLSEH
jgi:hypothetical protein